MDGETAVVSEPEEFVVSEEVASEISEEPKPRYKRPTPQPSPTSVRTPDELEPYIQAGIKRTGKSRHGYLLSCINYVAMKEKLPEESEEIP